MSILVRKAKISKARIPQYLFCFYVLFPIVTAFVILRLYPIIRTFLLSFHRWDLLSPVKPWVGFGNFVKAWRSPEFWEAFRNTTIFSALSVPCTMVLSLFLAILIDNPRIKRFVSIYQFIYFIPVVCSMVPSAVVWRWIYDPQCGLLNYFLSWFGIPAQGWLVDHKIALYSIIVFSVWKSVGYYMVIFYVGLKGMPFQYREAAKVDGANNWQIFTKITIPLLKPIVLLVSVIAVIGAYNVFTQVYILTTTASDMGLFVRVFVYEIYEQGFRFYRMGYASAVAICLFTIVALFTLLQFIMAREKT